jgi:hypothetical protein
MPQHKPLQNSVASPATFIPELEQTKNVALSSLTSVNTRRAYKHAIERFIAWYCSEPRLGLNRAIVLRYRSFLESLQLSAATVNLHLSAIRRLADEAAESSLLTPELAIGIRRVNRRVGFRNSVSGDPPRTATLISPALVAQAYGFPQAPPDASSQRIGVIEAAGTSSNPSGWTNTKPNGNHQHAGVVDCAQPLYHPNGP